MNSKFLLFAIAGLVFSTSYFVNDVFAEPGYEYVSVELDKKIYTWTDRVYITIVAPAHNFDSNSIDEIGNSEQYPVKIATRQFDLDNYKLVETGPDTGIFTGEVRLTGFAHDADGNAITGVDGNDVADINPKGTGPSDGLLPSDDDDGITVSFEFAIDETAVGSALIQWNEGKVKWLETDYPATGTGVVRVTDPDMNLDPDEFDNFDIDVWSDSDAGGIDLTLTETNKSTGIFEGTVFFTTTDESSGHRLRIAGGNTITAEYEDNTLPSPHTTSNELDITATSMIQKIPPLSPNKQLMKGIMTQDVTCKDKFEKIFRPNGFVACVDSSSVKKLMQKGWSLDLIPVNFTGEWKNMDSRTNDLANISFTQNGSVVTAHAWSSCKPDMCDWGESSGNVDGNIVTFTWKVDSVTHKITVAKIGHELKIDRESLSFKPKWTQNKQMDFIPVNSLQANSDNPAKVIEPKTQSENTRKLLTDDAEQFMIPDIVKESIREKVDSGTHQSVFVGVIDENGIDQYYYGNVAKNEHSINENTIFETGSISKVFTSLLLADMVNKGEVNLDDSIEKFLPENVDTPSKSDKQITLISLATHTSGLPVMPNYPPNPDLDKEYDYNKDGLYEYLSDFELSRDVGSQYEYSNTGASLLGHVLSLQSGKSYEQTLKERVWDKLGMDSTCIHQCQDMRDRFAKPHALGEVVDEVGLDADMAGAGGIRSSGKDLLTFLSYAMDLEKSELQSSFELTQTVNHDVNEIMSIGLGWHIVQKDNKTIFLHNGATEGFASFFGFDSDSNHGVVVLTNSQVLVDEIGFDLLDLNLEE